MKNRPLRKNKAGPPKARGGASAGVTSRQSAAAWRNEVERVLITEEQIEKRILILMIIG